MPAPERLLILRPGALGDVILTLPAVSLLRKLWPKAHFSWVGYPSNLEWLLGTCYLDSIHAIDKAMFCHLFDGRRDERLMAFFRGFDYCIAWVKDREGLLASLLTDCCDDRFILAPPFPERGSLVHAGDHLLASVAALVPSSWRLEPVVGSNAVACGDLPPSGGQVSEPFGIIHPGSGNRLKCWFLWKFQAVGKTLRHSTGIKIHWLLGPAEGDLESDIWHFCKRQGMDCSNSRSLPEVIDLLRNANFFLGNDCGITHLAAALGTTTFAVFGPTSPAEWAPRGPHVTLFWQRQPCNPCSDTDMRNCPDRRCLASIAEDTVIQSICTKTGMVTTPGISPEIAEVARRQL